MSQPQTEEVVIVTRPPTAILPPDLDIEKELLKQVSEKLGQVSPSENNFPFDLEAQTQTPTPEKKRFSQVRYIILNIYRRLFTLVFLANIAIFIYVMVVDRKLLALVNAAAANLLACGLARQPLVVNAIFVTVCSVPRSAPLWLRRIASKVYHYGGVHSGCGVASLIWYLGFVGQMSREYWCSSEGVPPFSVAAVVLTYVILVLLLAIIIVAYPGFRFKKHDYFELTHRFSGWLVVAFFIILLMVFVDGASSAESKPMGRFLIEFPAFWFLMVTVIAIVQPWLLLRKVKVQPEYLSPHAVRLHFNHTTTTFGKGIQLSKHPLQDWHGFATFPDPEGQTFSALVSKAGDWTCNESVQACCCRHNRFRNRSLPLVFGGREPAEAPSGVADEGACQDLREGSHEFGSQDGSKPGDDRYGVVGSRGYGSDGETDC